jgi:hypothetical protein
MPLRTFNDAGGREWRVWDVSPAGEHQSRFGSLAHLPEELATGWLCFEADGEKRRLCPVPEGWSEQSDGDIERLWLEAAPVALRRAMVRAATPALEAAIPA